MWRSWSKFIFFLNVNFNFPIRSNESPNENALQAYKTWKPEGSASCIVPNKRSESKMHCITLTAFVNKWVPAAKLLEMTRLHLFVIVFEAVCFIHMKVLRTSILSRIRIGEKCVHNIWQISTNMLTRSKFECRQLWTLSHPYRNARQNPSATSKLIVAVPHKWKTSANHWRREMKKKEPQKRSCLLHHCSEDWTLWRNVDVSLPESVERKVFDVSCSLWNRQI